MATAVMDLGFDLKTKLAWMIYEDTNLDLVGMNVRADALARAEEGEAQQ